MKKILKVLAALMASTMLFGAMFTSCSSDDNGGNETPEIRITSDGSTSVEVDSTLKLTSNVEDVSWKVDKVNYAALSAAEDGEFAETATGTTVYLKGVADGSVVVTASKDGYTDDTVTITVGTGGNGGEERDEPAEDDGSYIFTTNTLGYSSAQADTSIKESKSYLDGKVSLMADTEKGSMSVDVKGFSTANTFTEADVSVNGYIRLNARNNPEADSNWVTSISRAIVFSVPKDTAKVYIFAKGASKDKECNLSVYKADQTEVFNQKIDGNDYKTYTIDVASLGLAEDAQFILFNSKDNGGDGGINFKGLYVQMAQSPLSSIEITTQPTKTSYALNENLDTTGIAVKATYDNGKSKNVTSKVTYSDFDSSASGEKEITVSYTEGDVTKTATFKVTVTDKTLSSIAVKTNPTKTSYKAGESVDLTGLVITTTYSDGSTTYVSYSAENASSFTAAPAAIAADTTSVTVTYAEKTTTFDVTVKTLSSIAVKTNPAKTTYKTGDAVDLTGLVLKLTYSDESTEELTYSASSGVTASADLSVAGTAGVTVTYAGKSATFEVTVQTAVYFTKFDAAELYGDATGDVTIQAEKTEEKTVEATDGSWTLWIAKNKKVQVKSGTFATYDYDAENEVGYSWTNRLAFNKQGNTDVSLKLKVGAGKSVVLRVDGGNADGATSYTEGKTPAAFTFKGAGEAVTWSPVVSLSTFYASVTGDSDGYVVITATKEANANIYGITVVESAVDLTGKTREDVSYNKPTFTLEGTASIASGEESVVLEAGAKASRKTFTVSVDGTTVTTSDTELSDVVFTYTWSKDESVIDGATSATYEATAAGSYTVTASYTAADSKPYSATSSACVVTNLNQENVTVTFNANGGSGTMEPQTLAAGSGTLSANTYQRENYTFTGWATSETGEKEYDDKAAVNLTSDITLYAVWVDATSAKSLSGTWTALDYAPSAETCKDKTPSADGTSLGNVTVVGSDAVWRVSSNTWSHLELGKGSSGCLSFTISSASKIVVSAASTGGNNTSDIWLGTGSNGTTGSVTGSVEAVTGTSYTDVTYASVPAGTYYLGAFPATSNTRGVRIKSITVTAASTNE